MNLFDGIKNLTSIYNLLRTSDVRLAFLVYAVNIDDVLEISFSFKKKEIFLWDGNFAEFIRLVKCLYSINFIQLVNVNLDTVDNHDFNLDIPVHEYFEPVKPGIVNPAEAVEDRHLLDNLAGYRKNLPEADVLLLGDTPGQSSAGLLYLASYLKRNGINALCLFNDSFWETASLQKNIEELLMKVKPRIVGVSMKWFIHIARVLGISKIVKEYSKRNGMNIKVVLGGNSASFFWEDVIKDENVDYIIRGDGELPFLKLCRGETPVPNCVYKKDGEIIANPITYIQKPENSSDIYLSHMDEVMISHYSCVFGIFFVFTQKGCKKNCYYCGGCNDAQRIAFNRGGLFRRNVSEVRKDIIESKKYTSTIFFLFDEYSNDTLMEYCKEIWEGIDLSRHIGFLSNVILPTPELIEYCNQVFQYVYWNLDMASMSERHRLQLLSENMVKAQPTDRELLEIFDECEKYDNNEIIINFITGLPYFNREDIEASKQMLSHIINKYSCFGEYFWARLHAEPGAPVIAEADKYDMYSLASNYEEFYEYSRKSFQEFELYPNVDNFTYPYIYFKDEELNSAVSKYYVETHHQWLQYKKSKGQKAIVTNDLTYRQLNERAHRLAEILKDKGVRPDTIVGIMVERSLDMIVGLLGTLKAGGAYLPLDPEYPETRIAYMMEDCQAKLLLSQGHLVDRIPFKNDECEIIDLETMDVTSNSPAAPGAVKPVEQNREKNSLAYIIFTSGSTGKPKGVAIEHRSIVNTLVWRKNHYRFDENDIVLQLPSFSFDSSVEDIFTPLISGSQLLMVQAHQRFDMDYIRELLRTIAVTHFLNVPALYKTYLDEIPGALAGLKHITIAGENFTEDLVIRHFQYLPQVRVYNEYGPTENSVCSTAYQFDPDRTGISIGKPISNVRCYILDSSGGLCPIGTPGELCLAGAGISRGYVNNPGLTAEKFDRDKRKKVPGSNNYRSYRSYKSYKSYSSYIYKTGDLVRWLPDGNIEFLGRIDNQVKIRGYRVETGEISNRLLKHAAVDDAVVMVREYAGGEKYLAAYIVTAGRSAKLASELREYLAAVLPEYMVPSHFITIDRIPLTPGGKIDTRALPDPEAGLSDSYTAPGSEIERKLVEIWTEILPGSGESGDSTIGIDDNFFQLGGHSLKATAMVSRIHKIFNVKVPMMEIFNWPTVRGLSGYIKRTVGDRFISIEAAEKKSNYVLSAAQRRLYSFQQMNKTSIAYNSPNAYVLQEEIDKENLERAFKKLIQRHDSFRTSFHLEQNYPEYPVQRIHHQVEFVAAYHEVETKEAIEEILKHFARPFDLSRAPLLRVGLIKAGEGQQVLVYDMHHIITDGTSMEILIRDFIALYAGEELPGLRLQYKGYAQWQNCEARQEAVKEQEDFWLRTFAGEKPVLDLPTDHARPTVQDYEGSSFHFALEQEETQQLKALSVENEATLFMVLLGLFSVLLSRLSSQEDIVIGTGTEGRRHEDLRHIIGMFVNTLALRTYPGKNKTFGGFLKELKESTLAAFENQDYPFEDLVEKVLPHRDTSRNPLFDVVFQFQAAADSQNHARALKVKPYQMQVGISKFDLTLWGFETGETLFFYFEYCTRLFEEETIIKMAEYFKRIIAAVLKNPGEQLINIEIFTEEEQEAELVQLTDDLELDEME
jgi:amino acid adenylation domain-containing protein